MNDTKVFNKRLKEFAKNVIIGYFIKYLPETRVIVAAAVGVAMMIRLVLGVILVILGVLVAVVWVVVSAGVR